MAYCMTVTTTKWQCLGFRLWWIGASTVGGAVGVVTGGYCSLAVGYLFGDLNGQTDNILDMALILIMATIGGAIGGVLGGFTHWVLMRRSLHYIHLWLFRCAIWGVVAWIFVVGITVAGLILRIWNPFDHFTMTLAFVGALLGTISALVLGDRPGQSHLNQEESVVK